MALKKEEKYIARKGNMVSTEFESMYIKTLPNLLEVQRSSFCWFLSNGLIDELMNFSSIMDFGQKFELKLYAREIRLKRTKTKGVELKDRASSSNFKIYVPIELKQIIIDKESDFYFDIENDHKNVKNNIWTDLSNQIEIELDEMKKKLIDHESQLLKELELAETQENYLNFEQQLLKELLEIETNSSGPNIIIKKKRIFLGEIPLMTKKGTFIVNGCERVVINQLIRSPGVYYKKFKKNPNSKEFDYSATIISNKGSWLTFKITKRRFAVKDEKNNEITTLKPVIYLKIDNKYEIPINWVFTSLGITANEINQTVVNAEKLREIIADIKIEIEDIRKKDEKEKNTIQILVKRQRQDELAIYRARQLLKNKILNPRYYDLGEIGRVRINKKVGLDLPLFKTQLTSQDFLKIIDYLLDVSLSQRNAKLDQIDNLRNKRVRSVGELLQNQFRLALKRLENNFSDRIALINLDVLNASNLISPHTLTKTMKEFFGSSQLSQYYDETNPLAELTHKRRVTSLGPGGLSGEHVSFAARDIHPTQYGRLCPIETPEGKNAGLISSLACYARIDQYGYIQTPFFKVNQGLIEYKEFPTYLTAEQEDLYKIASADININDKNYINGKLIPAKYNQEFILVDLYEIDLISISPIQVLSIGTSLIPFLEHDDANRTLMGSNMQRQALPLLYPKKPIIGTGLEAKVAIDSGAMLINSQLGTVLQATSNQIIVKTKKNAHYNKYSLVKYIRSNQNTCINQIPVVWGGELVKPGQVLADSQGTDSGELALGQNLTVAYMPWEGYNYEDALVLSDRLIYENLFSSLHIEKYEVSIARTDTGPEKMTCDLPDRNFDSTKNLENNGIIYTGALVQSGDILVGKVSPKVNLDLTPEGKLLQAVFQYSLPDVVDTSFCVPEGISGRVIETIIYDTNDAINMTHLVIVFIAQIRKIKIGDKIAGRHGNKGIVSTILPIQDMPYLPDGTIVDVMLNPLGVPSRMNVGQIFESLLGLAGNELNSRFKIFPFDEIYSKESSRILINKKLKEAAKQTNKPWLFDAHTPGKMILRDGRTGETFDNPILVGKAYMLKLVHLVDKKIHARWTGPYSLITQQPVKGRARGGGQRFGEMEVWALEAFGAAYTLQELLTLKSDDMKGRNELLTAMVKGEPIPKPGVPESFKVLLRELRALGLDITTYKISKVENKQTITDMEVDLFN